jgi:hypothetical protein
MIPELFACAKTYAMGDRFLEGLVGDFTDADWQVSDPVGHNARWLVGHLATMRNRVSALAGLAPAAAPWEAAFGRGSSCTAVPADLDPRTLVQAFHEAQQALAGRWDAVSEADLAKPLGRTLPDGSDTVGGALHFLAWHEGYHLGQLGLIRRLAGKPGRA